MKNAKNNTLQVNGSTPTSTARRSTIGLTLTAAFLCGLAISASAQNPEAAAQIAPERGFTIAPRVQTPIVLKTQPDAECSLHAEGESDAAHTIKLFANADGYVRVHVAARQESQADARMQLDCAAAGKATTYPIRLRAASSPTDEMPAPRTSAPAPKGSQVLPALTEEDARQLSDDDLATLGYPLRPDAEESPDGYAKWLGWVSRPITLIPAHSVSRPDISHSRNVPAGTVQTANVEATAKGSANWSGYEAHGAKRSYMAVTGEWNVPPIPVGEAGYVTYSATWVGLDGDGTKDLVQAGTEQDYIDVSPFSFASYGAWTELLPNQPTEQVIGISPNPGDDMRVEVWIGTGSGAPNQNGGYGSFRVFDVTQSQEIVTYTALGSTHFTGSEAEWIMERPLVSGSYAELSAYLIEPMVNASALKTTNVWKNSNKIQNRTITMYNSDYNHPDNNELSTVIPAGTGAMFFNWFNFH